MKKSLSFKLVLFVLKIKGLKKILSQNPINYHQLRKEDVKRPRGSFYKKNIRNRYEILGTFITEIAAPKASNRLVIYLHGGAFVSGPGQHHWDTIKKIHKETQQTVWLCDYPKAPETKITELSKSIDAVYKIALEKYAPNAITLIGDSAGGTLIIALVQRLIQQKMPKPNKIILISPVLDATLPDPKSREINKTDPMLSVQGVRSAKVMCAENNNLKSPNLSPIYGKFQDFPKTILYLADNDITYPDQVKMAEKLKENGIDHEVVTGEGMPHVWPILPIMKEGKVALDGIISEIR